MMKKALALVMAGMLALSCAPAALAEEVPTVDYTMINEDLYDGAWVSAFGVFDLYLPADWDIIYNADAEDVPEDNVYFQAQNEDATRSVAISYAQTEDEDLESFAAKLTEAGYEEVGFMVVNDIPVVTYSLDDEEVSTAGIATIGDMGGLYNVTMGCVAGDEEFKEMALNMVFSFSATEYEEAETE